MSTYTDLHNRIKENLTILRKPGSKDDGMSPQKVILINPENQFYGTFNGKMNVTGGILSGLKIVDSKLERVKLDDATVDGVPLGELKTTVDVNTQDIEQLQKDAKAISAAHDALSVGLSSAVDNLSVAVNKKLDDAVVEVKKSISGVVGDVTTLSIGLDDLSSKVETLSSGMLNGVVYKGQLVLYHDIYTRPRQLFNDDPACCLLEGTQASLKNGWMWQIALDRQNVSGDYVHVSDPNTGKELDLGEGDYIIIKNHLTSLYEVVPDNKMRLDDFDVINAQDEDDTKLAVFKQISAFLNSKIEALSADLSGDIDDLSAALSGEIDSLSASLSNLISSLSGDLCAEIELDRKTIKEVSAETLMSANAYTDESIAQLSDTTSSLVSATSADTLTKAKTYAEEYADGRIDELSTTTDSRLSSLSNDLSSYSNKLCSDISTQVDAEYVHKAGDTIAKLSVAGDLDVAGKTSIGNSITINDDFREHSGTKAEVSKDKVEVETIAPISISTSNDASIKAKDISINAHEMSITANHGLSIDVEHGLEDINVNGKTVQNTLDDLSNYLNEKKLDVQLARQLSSQLMISTDLPSNVAFDYLSAENILRLGIQGTFYDIDVTEFLDDKIVENVYTTTEDGKIWLHITFRTSSSGVPKTIDICVNDMFRPYWAGHGISVDNNLCIHIADYFYDQVSSIQSYVDELSGPPGPRVGIISSLSAAIEAIDLAQTQELYFAGMIELDTADTSKHYSTVGQFLSTEIGGLDVPSQVRNNSYFTVKFFHGLSPSATIVTDDGLSVGDGDQIIIHEHNPSEGEEVKFISWGDLKLIDDDAAGNVYLIKAGVSRYEFEAEATKRADDDNYISSWIQRNFANTSADNELSTTILNYDVSATKELSVASKAYVLSDLSVAGQLFVNGAQLGIMVEPVDPDVPSGETETVARTIADEVEFTTSSADNAPTINITKNAISFSSAPVYVSTSSFIISNDQTKVVDATSSQVEILSVLTVSSDQARITTLSSGVLSSDALTSRVADISEKLSATNAYIDWLNVDNATITTLSTEVLSSDALTARVVDVYEKLNATSSYNEYLSASQIDAIEANVEKLSVDAFNAREAEISENLSVNNAVVKNELKVGNEFNALSGAFVCYKEDNGDVYVNTNADFVSIGVANENARKENPQLYPASTAIKIEPSCIDISSDEVIANFGNVKDRQSMSSITDLCSALSTSISSLEDYVVSCDAVLSTAVDRKIFIDGLSTETLSAIHISEDDFYQRVKDGQILSNELYIVSSENINAYGQQIKNLATPQLSDDAATKGYVDGISSSLSSQIQQLSNDLSSEIETLSTNLSTSISTLTSQIELALSALDKDPLSSLNRESKISTVIDAVLDIRNTLSALRTILRI